MTFLNEPAEPLTHIAPIVNRYGRVKPDHNGDVGAPFKPSGIAA